MLALAALFAVVLSSVTFTPDRGIVQAQSNVTVTLSASIGLEGDSQGTGTIGPLVKVRLNKVIQSPETFPLIFADGTAKSGSDYNAGFNSLTVPAGTWEGAETVSLIGDDDAEPSEYFTARLDTASPSWPSGYTAATTDPIKVIIDDDDNTAISGAVRIDIDDTKGKFADRPEVGEILTANTSGLSDADHTDDTSTPSVDESILTTGFSYQWKRGSSDISGETGKTYTLTEDDVGQNLTVEVKWLDKLGNGDTLPETATVTALDNPTVLYNKATPFIVVGTLTTRGLAPGVVLTKNTSGMFNSENPPQLIGDDGMIIDGDTSDDNNDPVPSRVPITEGTGDGQVNITWHRNGVELTWDDDGDATTAEIGDARTTYTLTDADVSETITLEANYTVKTGEDGDGNSIYTAQPALVSNKVGTNANPIISTNAATGEPAITGTVQVGETLTTNKGSIKDLDGAPAGQTHFIPAEKDITYDWYYGDDDEMTTSLHTGSTYALGAKDADKTLKVKASFKDGLGDPDSRESAPTYKVTGSLGKISKIEPAIRGVTVSGGDNVILEVEVYGVQGDMDQSLAKDVVLAWSVDPSGGTLPADTAGNYMVTYTAPSSPGTYTVSAEFANDGDCRPDKEEDRADDCSASFEVKVRRPSAPQPEEEAPANPPGDIPTILTDGSGNQYEVFTPVEGGTFDAGEGYSIMAPSSAVPNGEFIGVRMSDDGAASNLGMTHQRYTLGGNMYGVHAVDSTGTSISDYALEDAAKVCVPLPSMFRARISDLALVTINSDDSLTILAANVRLSDGGASVCGNLSNLPASVAVGSMGSPDAIPTATPVPTPVPPPTGATAPSSSGMVLWTLLLGTAAAALGISLLLTADHRRRQRRHTTNH